MAFPTAVNSQITDSVSQVNTKVLGDAPAIATGNFMIATSQALSNAAHNATSGQQNSSVTAQAALVQGVDTLLGINTATTAEGISKVFR
ncbi:RebB family R body protein [Pseudoalteromonas luteoviolacea]|uniref:Glycerol-3-phosphate dehydrogenase subunit C n=3 Tax=Pseudoalteromonas luteoviolacea TaxID=43657 RepID=A0A167MZQ4_9GAMM|nr:RebB family R body protein [Pseudoalteromonas luteoviolacea]KID59036.1 glycerol-3-phosphate dehydrogenase [Pseudoalteromonas luteoviolacea]KZN51647.1 glycerol-3-phosphate dehydrogenase subunit C [Pseudoalteromonas luteoviolacea H33]KZN67204.1 glycerol-3-phosphate dehydrogenase subunit C [Pseudoalteromonas luteoviolacea CPMOR-1]KZN79096.1 glycerol-3-phosphate dehydrogenase subunit C [Pseudoalteromonas luteoviolacea H33-S]MBQ4878228.1 RebB family R body protein [Pseudoalteromonas luteoviolace